MLQLMCKSGSTLQLLRVAKYAWGAYVCSKYIVSMLGNAHQAKCMFARM